MAINVIQDALLIWFRWCRTYYSQAYLSWEALKLSQSCLCPVVSSFTHICIITCAGVKVNRRALSAPTAISSAILVQLPASTCASPISVSHRQVCQFIYLYQIIQECSDGCSANRVPTNLVVRIMKINFMWFFRTFSPRHSLSRPRRRSNAKAEQQIG